MLDQGLFKKHFYGKDGFVWWIGQIPDEKTWRTNIPGMSTASNKEHDGFGWRYKVRIMGYHPASKELPDEQLPWCGVVFPVTAGSGAGGASMSPNLRQGNFVYGFFLDGDDGQMPVIMGVIDNNDYTAIQKDIPEVPFVPFSGYTSNPGKLTRAALPLIQDLELVAKAFKFPGEVQSINNDTAIESSTGYDGRSDGATREQFIDGSKVEPIPVPTLKEKAPLPRIQKEVQNLIADVQRYKKSLTDWETKVSTKVDDVDAAIQKSMKNATKMISGNVKTILKEVQQNVTSKLNFNLKDKYFDLFPTERPALKAAVETANDAIACMFKGLIDGLFDMVGGFLENAVDKFINTPLCAVESFVGALLGKISGIVAGGLDDLLGPIKSLLGGIDISSITGNPVDFVIDSISFLDCEEEPAESDIREWSPWKGALPVPNTNMASLVSEVKGFADQAKSALSGVKGLAQGIAGGGLRKAIGKGITGGIDDAFGVTNALSSVLGGGLSDVFDSLGGGCNVGPKFCGPPTVEFFGGKGIGGAVKGVLGNAIVSGGGSVLGVDLIQSGVGFKVPPLVQFNDACNKGRGATARAILGPVKAAGTPAASGTFTGDISSDSDTITNVSNTTNLAPGVNVTVVSGNGTVTGQSNHKVVSISGTTVTLDQTFGGSGTATTALFLSGTNQGDVALDPNGNILYIPDDSVAKNDDGTYPEGTTLGVVSVAVTNGGIDYLSTPDGSQGGDGRTWANVDETTLKRADGTYETPMKPGQTVEVFPGDEITYPGGIITDVTRQESITTPPPTVNSVNVNGIIPPSTTGTTTTGGTGVAGDTGGATGNLGGEGTNAIIISKPIPTLANDRTGAYPSLGDGSYPVILEIGSMFITDSGFNYREDDTVVIEPRNGAELKVKLDGTGSLTGVDVISKGQGFIEEPNVYIRSKTGYNATIVPIFNVKSVGSGDGEDIPNIPLTDSIIKVIDCVGKI